MNRNDRKFIDKTEMERIIELVLKEADNRELDAGYGGRYDDGGAFRLRDAVKYYRLGRDGIIPSEWEKYEKMLDPEYAKYLELKKKFED